MTFRYILTLMLFFAVGCASVSSKAKTMVGQPVPAARLVLTDGTYTSIDAYRGKDLILQFWACHCNKAKNALLEFAELAKRFQGTKRLEFIAVNIDKLQDEEKTRKFLVQNKLGYLTHAFSGNDVHDEAYVNLDGEALPYFAVIGKDGTLKLVTLDVSEVEDYLHEKYHR